MECVPRLDILSEILRNKELIVNDVENAMREENEKIQETGHENIVQSIDGDTRK